MGKTFGQEQNGELLLAEGLFVYGFRAVYSCFEISFIYDFRSWADLSTKALLLFFRRILSPKLIGQALDHLLF